MCIVVSLSSGVVVSLGLARWYPFSPSLQAYRHVKHRDVLSMDVWLSSAIDRERLGALAAQSAGMFGRIGCMTRRRFHR